MRFLIIFIIFCFSIFADEMISLQLKWEHQFQFAGYYAALEKGYYKENGLDVQIKGQNTSRFVKASNEVMEGRAQYGIGSSSLFVDISQDKPLMLLAAIFEHSPLVLVCSQKAEARKPKDLDGKRIMFSSDEGESFLLSRMLDQEGITYESVPFDFTLFEEGKVDAFTGYIWDQPYTLAQKNHPFSIIDPANYGLDMYSDILFTSQEEYLNHPKRVQNFINASIKGWQYAMSHQSEIAKLIIKKYNPNKSFEALLYEASMIQKHAILDTNNIGDIELNKLSHILLKMKELGILQKDVNIYKHLYPGQLSQIEFSAEEKEWIGSHPNIFYASTHWLPQENRANEKEISQRYMELLALKSGLNIIYKQKEPYTYALAELERGRIDLFIGTQESKNSLQTLDIRSYPLVIVTKNDVDYISDIQSMDMKTMALLRGSEAAKYIEDNHPEIQRVYVEDIKEALELVSSSSVYATIEALPLIALHIKEYHIANVKISGELPYDYKLKINVRSDYSPLRSILNKAIKAVSVDEHNIINHRWESSEFIKEKDITGFVVAIIISGLLISVLVYSNWRLHFEVQKRESAEQELQRMLDVVNQNVYMSMTDTDGNITYVSDAFCRLTGYTKEQLLGNNHRMLKSPLTSNDFYKKLWEKISTGNVWKGELENVSKSGEVYWVDASITPIYDEQGKISSYMAIRKDITSKKQLETLAITDALSNLYNRRYFNMIFEKEIKRLRREHGTMTFMMLDIDHFKLYNDKYGHLKGDEVLISVSQCLKEVCQRETDQVFRLGGEEFGIVLLGMDDVQVHTFAQKLIKSIEHLNIKHEENAPYSWVTASLGAVVCKFDETSKLDAKDIYQIADDAMYTSKQTGRNRVFISQA